MMIMVMIVIMMMMVIISSGHFFLDDRPIRRKFVRSRRDSIEEKPLILPCTMTSTFRPSF